MKLGTLLYLAHLVAIFAILYLVYKTRKDAQALRAALDASGATSPTA